VNGKFLTNPETWLPQSTQPLDFLVCGFYPETPLPAALAYLQTFLLLTVTTSKSDLPLEKKK
jgi:hypothetical protein